MNGSTGRLGGALFAIAATLLLASASEAVAQTVPSDLRVVASDGQELADVRQYVGKTVVPTSPNADCFGPGNQGSGDKVTQVGPDALSVVVEASAAKDRLRPLLLTDAFLDDGFGLGVCAIGGYVAPPSGFWYLKVNHKNPNLGGSLVTVGPGTETLWYLISSSTFPEPPPSELVLSAPARTAPGVPVRVAVLAYADDGIASPASRGGGRGRQRSGDGRCERRRQRQLLPAGRAGAEGDPRRRHPEPVPWRMRRQPADPMPEVRGREILGTDGPDNVVGTLGADQVRPRAGNDNIKSRGGGDLIVSRGGGADKVKCGGGKDVVEADKKDWIGKSCEKVKGGKKAGKKGKRK